MFIKLQIKHDFSDAASYVTVSIGAAETIPTVDNNNIHLIELADSALYIAKSKGRNRIAVSRQDNNIVN